MSDSPQRPSAWKRWRSTVITIVVIAAGWWVLQRPAVQEMLLASSPPPLQGDIDPASPHFPAEVRAENTTGALVPLHTHGRPAVVNLFATWCPPCVAELPSLLRLREQVGDDADVQIVSSEPLKDVRAWAIRRGLDPDAFLHLDAGDVSGVLATRSVPVTWVVSPDGRLLRRVHGAHAWDDPAVSSFLQALVTGSGPRNRVSFPAAKGP